MKKWVILPLLAVGTMILMTGCGVRLRSVEELQQEAERKYGGTVVSVHSDAKEHAVVMQDADYNFTYTIRSIRGRKQVYFDAANTKPAERTECNYYAALICYIEAQAAEELDAYLEEQHAYRTPGREYSDADYDAIGTIINMEWCFTVKDKSSAWRVAEFCSEMVEKYDPEEKLKSKGEILIFTEDGWIAGSQLFHDRK